VKSYRATLILLCISLGICLSAAAPSRGESIREKLYRHMASMPTDSVTKRRAFTRADTLTREYIIEQFAASGSRPVFGNGGWLQPFPVIRRTRLALGSGASVTSGSLSWILERKDEFVPHAQSGDGVFSGGVAFIGYGIRAPHDGYDDFSRVDLEGKTVICFSSPPVHIDKGLRKKAWRLNYFDKIALVDSLGGRAVVFVQPSSYKSCNTLHDLNDAHISSFSHRRKIAGIPIMDISHDALTRMMELAGIDVASVERDLETSTSSLAFVLPGVEISMNIDMERDYSDAYNVLGLLEGRDTMRTIVVGAHYDGPSYNDNASGVAVMLELARLCGERGPFDCNLLFAAFGLEERGLLGSRHFVHNRPPRAAEVKAMLNFDVIGRIRGDTLVAGNVQPEGEWERIASGLDSRGLVVVSKPIVWASDSYSFFEAGIPAFFFNNGFYENVHARDSLAAMNLDGMERALLYTFDFLQTIAGDGIELGEPSRDCFPKHPPRSAGP